MSSKKEDTIQTNKYRTHTNGELTKNHVGQQVRLAGWVHNRRDHGGLIFIDLRDRWGITQVTFDPTKNQEAHAQAEQLRDEYVIQIAGTVQARPANMVNKDLTTGEIEIEVTGVSQLSTAITPPFPLDINTSSVNEETRLEHRYLDLRSVRMQQNITRRHQLLQQIRRFFYSRDFIEIETPILIKGTPEGAREYVVPSRLYPGQFYVLPQSPQQLKQLSMVAGFDRYMQVARCFRDEDQRGDRQPEFTQIDVEMSFIEADDVLSITEECLLELTKEIRPDVTIKEEPFPRLTWQEAMNTYGSDKPDLRYDLPFTDVTELCRDSDFSIFADAVKAGGVVKALRVPGGATLTRADIDALTEVAQTYQAKGLAWIKVTADGHVGVPVAKLGDQVVAAIVAANSAKPDDLLLFSADQFDIACLSLGAVRADIAQRLKLVDDTLFAYCWVTDFPLFEKNSEGDVTSMHHPFTRPKAEDIDKLASDPLAVRAEAYDIALNGNEIAGGSIRIHELELQQKIFSLLGISEEEAKQRFDHMLKAFSYGAPPHGGIAWGFDRLAMLFAGEPNIREVMAFPKDSKARDLLTGAPSSITDQQLAELHLELDLDD